MVEKRTFSSPAITDRVRDIKRIHVNWTTKSFAVNVDDIICLFLAMCSKLKASINSTNLLPGERVKLI